MSGHIAYIPHLADILQGSLLTTFVIQMCEAIIQVFDGKMLTKYRRYSLQSGNCNSHRTRMVTGICSIREAMFKVRSETDGTV